MRVLTVTTSFPGTVRPYNGVFVREHSKELISRGHKVRVLVPHVFREDPADESVGDIQVHRFPFWSAQKLLVEYDGVPVLRVATLLISGILSTRLWARRGKADVIHAHWAIPSGLIAVIAGRWARVPVVMTVHRADLVLALEGPAMARRLMQYALDRADRVIVVSERQVGEMAEEFGLSRDRVVAIPMGADTKEFKPSDAAVAREALGLPSTGRIVLFVGGLTEVKGVRELVRAVPQIVAEFPDTHIVLAGEGPLADELASTVDDLGMSEAVLMQGGVDHDDVCTYMNAADVLVLPSYSEGLPVCLMEAAAVGLPAVASDVGGSAEVVVLNDASELIEPGDPAVIAAAINRVLARAGSGERTPTITDEDPYSLAGAVARLEGVYETVIEQAGR